MATANAPFLMVNAISMHFSDVEVIAKKKDRDPEKL